MIGEHPCPIGLVGWRRRKGRVGADGRQEDEQRRAGAAAALERIHLRQRKLIRDVPPAKLRAFVGQPLSAVDVLESVERALRPGRPEPGHDRQRPISMPRELGDDRFALLHHQLRIGVRIADLDPREKADVCEPRRATEGW